MNKNNFMIAPLRWAKKEYTDESLFISCEEIKIDTIWTAITPYHIYEIYENDGDKKVQVLLNDKDCFESFNSVELAKEAVQHEYERIVAEVVKDCTFPIVTVSGA